MHPTALAAGLPDMLYGAKNLLVFEPIATFLPCPA
jgi:hypothetical protein